MWAEEVCLRILESHALAVAVTCLVSVPTHTVLRSLPSSAASRERGKVFGLNAVGRSMADKLTLVEVMVRQARRPDEGTEGL